MLTHMDVHGNVPGTRRIHKGRDLLQTEACGYLAAEAVYSAAGIPSRVHRTNHRSVSTGQFKGSHLGGRTMQVSVHLLESHRCIVDYIRSVIPCIHISRFCKIWQWVYSTDCQRYLTPHWMGPYLSACAELVGRTPILQSRTIGP
jgi:hypothetical protein